MKRTNRPLLELLEDRTVPARYGIPWSDPTHLTLSFAPDGTRVAGQQSQLFQTLNAQQPAMQWQGAILRAMQTWVVNANLNVGVVADGGQPFGKGGPGHGNPRFGDIRIAAVPMKADVLAIAVPNDPFLAGSWSGDVILNSAFDFTSPTSDLYSVMLHEFGNALGLPDSTDPTSAMYEAATQPRGQLAPSDVAALQALYGARGPDAPQLGGAGASLANAQLLAYPANGYQGQTPLVQYGNLAVPGDSQVFAVPALSTYQGGMTFRLQTAGISLLEPHLTVYDAAGQVVGSVASYQLLGDVITVTVPTVKPGAVYYARVEGKTGDVFGAGRFALAVTFDTQLQTPANVIDTILTGPYDSLSPTELQQLFQDPSRAFHHDDSSDQESQATGQELRDRGGDAEQTHSGVIRNLADIGNVTYYHSTAQPSDDSTEYVLTGQGAKPAAGDSWDSTQTDGSRHYHFSRSGDHGEDGADGGGTATVPSMTPLIDGSLTAAAPQQGGMLLLGQTQIVQFVLSTGPSTAGAGAGVQMTVTDPGNNVLLDVTAGAGNTVGGAGVLLSPGAYKISLKAVSSNGTGPASLDYHLRAASLSDPIGPVLNNPTLAPTPVWPVDPSQYNNIAKQLLKNPFFWLNNVV